MEAGSSSLGNEVKVINKVIEATLAPTTFGALGDSSRKR